MAGVIHFRGRLTVGVNYKWTVLMITTKKIGFHGAPRGSIVVIAIPSMASSISVQIA